MKASRCATFALLAEERGLISNLLYVYRVARSQRDLAHFRHVASARFITREIDRFQIQWLKLDNGVDRLGKLLAMRDREVRGMLATARALRLTNQSRYRPTTAATAKGGIPAGARKPWD